MARYDLILKGGRALDYESSMDAVCDVAIERGQISEIAEELDPALAAETLDVTGLWVCPGVIDAHAHFAGPFRDGTDPAVGLPQLAEAGVTTAIDLGGFMDSLIDGVRRRGSGITVGSLARITPGDNVPSEEPTVAQANEALSRALAEGSLGGKMLGGYYPLTPDGTANVIEAANRLRAYVAFHIGTTETGSRLDGLREVPALLGSRGRLHIAHVNAYCRGSILDPADEVKEALEIVTSLRGRVVSEVHMAIPNFTRGACGEDGRVLADVARNCLRLRGYPTTADGMRAALRDGYASVGVFRQERLVLVSGEEGVAEFDRRATDATMSFPVNLPATAFALTNARHEDGEFIIDAVASDGGMLPRNVNVEQTMAMVRFGALSPLEMVAKLSYNPSRMLGLVGKGRLAAGADADVTVIDPERGRAVMGIAGGRTIMREGRAVGAGGTLLATAAGENAARASGLPYEVVDFERSRLYAGATQ